MNEKRVCLMYYTREMPAVQIEKLQILHKDDDFLYYNGPNSTGCSGGPVLSLQNPMNILGVHLAPSKKANFGAMIVNIHSIIDWIRSEVDGACNQRERQSFVMPLVSPRQLFRDKKNSPPK